MILRRNLFIYGFGGLVVPFVGIKLIDVLLVAHPSGLRISHASQPTPARDRDDARALRHHGLHLSGRRHRPRAGALSAPGERLARDGQRPVVGSALIGQPFTQPEYFHPRPSAAGTGYDATASSGTNKGPTDRKLADTLIAQAVDSAVKNDGAVKGAIPSDMVTSSASGLDPHISPANAYLQVARVARARGARLGSRARARRRGTSKAGSSASSASRASTFSSSTSRSTARSRNDQINHSRGDHASAWVFISPRRRAGAQGSPCEPDTVGKKPDPFAFADFTWLNGNPRTKDSPLDTKYFTGEFRARRDLHRRLQSSRAITRSSARRRAAGRARFRCSSSASAAISTADSLHGRFMTQFGMYSTMTPRNDASPGRGQWQLDNAYRYLSEAYGGRHWNKMNGINLDAGIFLSYVGLFSYYNFDNWAYQPSYVSSNTPWFFNGIRMQFFPTEHLKIEPWLINGWQSYGMFNEAPGRRRADPLSSERLAVDAHERLLRPRLARPSRSLAPPHGQQHRGEVLRQPQEDLRQGGVLAHARRRMRARRRRELHGQPRRRSDSRAFSASCCTIEAGSPTTSIGLTLGGGAMNNPGRYLVLLPPINGATAFSGTPYFTENPGDQFKAWDASVTFDYMPDQYTTFRFEFDHRESNIPYFAGPGGITPVGGNQGLPGSVVDNFFPDLRKTETRLNFALLVKL